MKKLLALLAVTIVMVSCQNKSADKTTVLSASDSADYKAFVKMKRAKEADSARKSNMEINKGNPNGSSNSNNGATTTGNTANTKKGWSKSAKGAVIGGVVGATAGAIINKRAPAVGAVVGGVVGAGAGYEIGRSKDKKDGRN